MDKENVVYIYMCVCVCVYTHTYTYMHTHNKILFSHEKETLLFVTTWIDLKGIMLSEISQIKINSVLSHLHMEPK